MGAGRRRPPRTDELGLDIAVDDTGGDALSITLVTGIEDIKTALVGNSHLPRWRFPFK